MVEQGTLNPKVRGSSPRRSTRNLKPPRGGFFGFWWPEGREPVRGRAQRATSSESPTGLRQENVPVARFQQTPRALAPEVGTRLVVTLQAGRGAWQVRYLKPPRGGFFGFWWSEGREPIRGAALGERGRLRPKPHTRGDLGVNRDERVRALRPKCDMPSRMGVISRRPARGLRPERSTPTRLGVKHARQEGPITPNQIQHRPVGRKRTRQERLITPKVRHAIPNGRKRARQERPITPNRAQRRPVGRKRTRYAPSLLFTCRYGRHRCSHGKIIGSHT